MGLIMNELLQANAFCDDALGDGDATAVAERIKKGEVSAAEVLEATIQRAEAFNPNLNAIAQQNNDIARRNIADLVEGPFHGVPTFVKDNTNVKGFTAQHGSNTVPALVSDHDGSFAQMFKRTGVNILGMSTMPEFGLTCTTENLLNGQTVNPWGSTLSTGGSSGGAAALVAAGIVPIAHANDGGGSIRIPASCCGLVGFKPTVGRVPSPDVPGFYPANILAQGILSRTVRDTVAFFLAAEKQNKPSHIPEIGSDVRPLERSIRIGMFTDNIDGLECDSKVREEVHRIGRHCESLGHRVEGISNPFPRDLFDSFMLLWSLAPAAHTWLGSNLVAKGFDASQFEPWSRYLRGYFFRNFTSIRSSFKKLSKFLNEDYPNVFRKYDVILSPTIASPGIPLGYLGVGVEPEVHMNRVRSLPYTIFQNIAEAPAVSLPVGSSANGAPIGVMFGAGKGEDRLLMELAFLLEESVSFTTLSKR